MKFTENELDNPIFVYISLDDDNHFVDYFPKMTDVFDSGYENYMMMNYSSMKELIDAGIEVSDLMIKPEYVDQLKANNNIIQTLYHITANKEDNINILNKSYTKSTINCIKFDLEIMRDQYINRGVPYLVNSELIQFSFDDNDKNEFNNTYLSLMENKEFAVKLLNGGNEYTLLKNEFLELYDLEKKNCALNEIYYEVLCEWLSKTYTVEKALSKTYVDYGYTDDDILEALTEKLEEHGLQLNL